MQNRLIVFIFFIIFLLQFSALENPSMHPVDGPRHVNGVFPSPWAAWDSAVEFKLILREVENYPSNSYLPMLGPLLGSRTRWAWWRGPIR